MTDPASESVRSVLAPTLRLQSELSVARDPRGGVRVAWRTPDGRSGEERFERVIAAAGRRPNLAGLELAKTGLELDGRGVPVYDKRTMQCGDAPVFLAGDASADRAVLHEAADEGRIAGANAAGWPDAGAPAPHPLAIVFTHPEIALAGARFADLDPGAIEIGEVFWEDQGRARVMGVNAGLTRLYADRECGTLVGAEMFGPRVEHTAHLLAWAIQERLTVERALQNPFYHPVIEEGIQTALRDLEAQLKLAPARRPEDLECGPGLTALTPRGWGGTAPSPVHPFCQGACYPRASPLKVVVSVRAAVTRDRMACGDACRARPGHVFQFWDARRRRPGPARAAGRSIDLPADRVRVTPPGSSPVTNARPPGVPAQRGRSVELSAAASSARPSAQWRG
jgi:hypothetical protein